MPGRSRTVELFEQSKRTRPNQVRGQDQLGRAVVQAVEAHAIGCLTDPANRHRLTGIGDESALCVATHETAPQIEARAGDWLTTHTTEYRTDTTPTTHHRRMSDDHRTDQATHWPTLTRREAR